MSDNMLKIRSRVKFHIRDVKFSDVEIDAIILQVIEDIANDTKLFKKIIGFTVHEDKGVYDFRDLTRMNERVEIELESVTITPYSVQDIIEYISGGEYKDPEVNKVNFIEDPGQSKFLDLIDIFDEYGMSIYDKFEYHGTAEYYCLNQTWLKSNDGKPKAFTAAVVPAVDEILEEDIITIMPSIIEGCKYYFNDTFTGQNDIQVANVFYQRYWQKRQQLINQYPTQVISKGRNKQWL